MGQGSCADGGDLARFLQALAEEGPLSHRASEVSSHRASDGSNSCGSSQHGRSAGSTEAPAGVQRGQQEDLDMTDPQLEEVLHQISSCGLPDPVSTAAWHAREDSMPQSPVQADERPAALDSHLDTELRVSGDGSMEGSTSDDLGAASTALCREAGRCSKPSGLLEVKQQQVCLCVIWPQLQVRTGPADPHCHLVKQTVSSANFPHTVAC